ncbi:hypothetical protein PO124_24795 [Bacillus licheniformis]|nr:hypothetical protein [Bacillus licheniformis]
MFIMQIIVYTGYEVEDYLKRRFVPACTAPSANGIEGKDYRVHISGSG